MKTKLRKTLYIVAAALFIGGLGVNIYMALDDPFENVSSLVLAEKTDSGHTSSGGCSIAEGDNCFKENYQTKDALMVTKIKGQLSAGIDLSLGDIITNQEIANLGIEGQIEWEVHGFYRTFCDLLQITPRIMFVV